MRIIKIRELLYISIFLFLSGCSGLETEDLFDKPASIRLEENRSQIHNALESSEQGWLLQYFPHPDKIYGGVNYFLTFKDGKVTAKSEKETEPETSSYEVLTRGGTVLSFNQYNSQLHFYATPHGGFINEPKGKQGDFEFLVLKQKEDTIFLKGLRTGNYMNLIRLNKQYGEVEEKIKQNQLRLESKSLFFYGNLDGEVISAEKDASKITFNYNGNTYSEAYIYTEEGLTLYAPIEIQGKKYQKFILDFDKKSFTSLSKDLVMKIVLPPFDIEHKQWAIDVSDTSVSNSVNEVFQAIFKANSDRWDETLSKRIILGDTKELNIVGIRFYSLITPGSNLGYPAIRDLNFRGVADDENLLDIRLNNGNGYQWNYYGHLQPFVDLITSKSPFVVEKDTTSGRFKLTSQKDASVWFYLEEVL